MPGRMITVLVTAFVLAAFPLTAVIASSRENVRGSVKADTCDFIEHIRETGVITEAELASFREKAALYLDDFKLDISVGRTYDFVASNTGVKSGGDTSGEFVLLASHTHTDDCYKGHNHTACGCARHTAHTNSCYGITECDGQISSGGLNMERRCNQCDADLATAIYEYEGGLDIFKGWVGIYNCGCNKGYYTTHEYFCKKCRKRYEFGGNGEFKYRSVCGAKTKTLVCGMDVGAYDCGITSEDNTPVCDRVITSLEGKSQVLFAGEGDRLDRSVKITYLDGHTEDGVARAEGFAGKTPGTYNVKLTVEGYAGSAKNFGAAETEITVLVIPRTKTCPNGHEYEVSDSGIDEGCPLCRNTFKKIYPLNAYVETEFGGEEPDFTILGEYMDGNVRELGRDEFVTDYDPAVCGLQTVEVRLKDDPGGEIKTSFKVYAVKTYECETCHRVHEADREGKDGGCPFCTGEIKGIRVEPAKTELESGEELEVFVYAILGDREERIYEEWTSDYDPEVCGEQKITVICLGFSYEIDLTVKEEETVSCPICGGVYDRDEETCPLCRKDVTGLSVREKEGEIIFKGGVPGFEIRVTYADGTEETVTDGYYLEGYDPEEIGRQSVIISYEGYSETVDVMVWPERPGYEKCEEGHFYLPLYDGEPCPYCKDKPEDDSSHEIVYHTDEILELIGREGAFKLSDGDAVTVSIVWGERLSRFVLFGGGRQTASVCEGFLYDERWGDGD